MSIWSKRSLSNIRKICIALVVVMTFQIVYPVTAYALTSGPTQPEVQSFKPVGASQMVDLFSGDFSYNIPLLEVPGSNGGYPINLFYNSVTDAETEASMVGLGWNVGIGAVTTNVRGIPDAFNGGSDEMITTKTDMRDSWTFGLGASTMIPLVDFEIAGGDLGKGNQMDTLGLDLGVTFLMDSHKGFGVSIEPGLKIDMGNSKVQGGMNLGMSFNSLEGTSVSPGLSFSSVGDGFGGNVGLTFNSTAGLSMSLGMSASKNRGKRKDDSNKASIAASGSGTFSFAHPTYTPTVSPEYVGINLGLNVAVGGEIFFTNLDTNFRGFYSRRSIKSNYKRGIKSPAFGHLYAQNAMGKKNSLMDFNKEKEGILQRNTPNLAIPFPTADVITVNGQGVAGSFMTMRSDQGGVFLDQEKESKTKGGNLGLEFATGTGVKAGIDPGYNWSRSFIERSTKYHGNQNSGFKFHGEEIGNEFEPAYIKASSDITADDSSEKANMGGDEPIQQIFNSGGHPTNTGLSFVNSPDGVDNLLNGSFSSGFTNLGTGINGKRDERKPRNSPIQTLTNKELFNGTLPIYNVDYIDLVSGNQHYDAPAISEAELGETREPVERKNNSQIGAYTSLTADGLRYIYALPVMNNEKHEVTFSTASQLEPCDRTVTIPLGNQGDIDNIDYEQPGTDQYLKHIETPAHSVSHLLTSVIGADYVDVDPEDGTPNAKDRGYWMNVDYYKVADEYIWKSPFKGANASRGAATKRSDDKGMFSAGSREQFYPAKISTNTHEARFFYKKRKDAKGAGSLVQNDNDDLGATSYALEKIELYSQKELANNGSSTTPIKTVHFKYADGTNPDVPELCRGIENHEDNIGGGNGGKLTLEAVWFTYRNNNKGALNPYKFEYGVDGLNPDYDPLAFDRWGVFRENSDTGVDENGDIIIEEGDRCYNFHEPYVNQDPDGEDQLNRDVAAWHLSKIQLPSGSDIEIEVARDHYAYVQDRVATQMFKIAGFGSDGISLISKKNVTDLPDSRKIIFDLETPIPVNSDVAGAMNKYIEDLPSNKYIDDDDNNKEINVKQIFYKVYVDLLNKGLQHADVVTGYVNIRMNSDTESDNFGVDANSVEDGAYTRGFVKVELLRELEGKASNRHPMTALNWQYIKTMLPDQMYGDVGDDLPDNPSDNDVVNQIGNILANMVKMGDIFGAYYNYCKRKNFGRKVDLKRSFIKLNSPDKRKYGGGIRVEKVVMKDDNWDSVEKTPDYGVIYEYDKHEEKYDLNTKKYVKTGNIISSGVALNEPAVGGEENALKYAKNFVNDIKYMKDEAFYFEYPINESLYPGPSIGYSKVTVKSLATDLAIQQNETGFDPLSFVTDSYEYINGVLDGFAASGITVNEFYTAKDFPTVAKETKIEKYYGKDGIYIPTIGGININYFSGSQGYMIELNDMHGKPKKNTTYGLDINGDILEKPISWSEYHYQHSDEIYTPYATIDSRHRKRLENEVDAVSDDAATFLQATIDHSVELGVDRQFFTSALDKKSRSYSVGLDLNFNFEPPFFFAAIPWPNFNYTSSSLKTNVTNKIINKKGILKKVIAYDGQSRVETENRLFDPMTGSAILTVVNNNFDDPIYSYNIPARFAYENTGAAYENLGYVFSATPDSNCDERDGIYKLSLDSDASNSELLRKGDEYLVYEKDKPLSSPIGRATLLDMNSLEVKMKSNIALGSTDGYTFKVIRSGKRNHLTASVASIVALEDPTVGRRAESCSVDIAVPTLVEVTTCQINPAFQAYIDLQQDIMTNGDWAEMAGDDLIDFSEEPYASDYQNSLVDINDGLDGETITTLDILSEGTSSEQVVLGCDDVPPVGNPGGCTSHYLDVWTNLNGTSFDPVQGTFGHTNINVSFTPNIDYSGLVVYLECSGAEPSSPDRTNLYPIYGGTSPVNYVIDEPGNGAAVSISWDNIQTPTCRNSPYVRVVAELPDNCGSGTIKKWFYLYQEIPLNSRLATSALLRNTTNPLNRILDANTVFTDVEALDCNNDYVPVVYMNTETGETMVKNIHGVGNGACYIPATIETIGYEIQSTMVPITTNYVEIDEVLQSSAMTMKSNWSLEEAINCEQEENPYLSGNPYANAEDGVWRLHETYAYVGNKDRSQSSDVDLEKDGTYTLEMFNHQDPIGNSCTDRWRKVEEVTRYSSNGAALESKDALGIYSSALYGYNNHLPIAVAANAEYPEIAYEGFEEFSSLTSPEGRESGHITYLDACAETFNQQMIVSGHVYSYMAGNISNVDMLYFPQMNSQNASLIQGKEFEYDLECTNGEVYTVKGIIEELTPVISGGYRAMVNYDECKSDDLPTVGFNFSNIFNFNYLICDAALVVINLGTETNPGTSYSGISLEKSKSHTGKNSLKISGNTTIIQKELNLEQGKKYMFSAWVHLNDNNTPTFSNKCSVLFNGVQMSPSGNIINGWQRIEQEFTYNGLPTNLTLQPLNGTAFYIDDVRIFPSNGNIQTYVYDPIDYRVTEILDNNNFFTRYSYDSEGNVTSVAKETREGIKTIQEAGSYIRPTN